MPNVADKRFEAFVDFGRRMLSSADIDPVYPVLKRIVDEKPTSQRSGDWLVVLYLAYYNVASACEVWLRYPEPDDALLHDHYMLKRPTGTERRGLRVPEKMATHLATWVHGVSSVPFDQLRSYMGTNPFRNDYLIAEYLEAFPYNGRWASYKGCEVLHKVLGFPNAARDAGHAHSSGPRQGLGLFYRPVPGNTDKAVRELNAQTDDLLDRCGHAGLKLNVEELETLLCDFHSAAHGRYYVGHDADLMWEQAMKAPADARELVRFGRAALPRAYRCELDGYDGRKRALMRSYVDTGRVADSTDEVAA